VGRLFFIDGISFLSPPVVSKQLSNFKAIKVFFVDIFIFYFFIRNKRNLLLGFQLANEKNVPQTELMKEVTAILDDMAHVLNMRTVRGVAFVVIKVFKALFKRVYVSEEGIQMVRSDQTAYIPYSLNLHFLLELFLVGLREKRDPLGNRLARFCRTDSICTTIF